MKCRRCTRSRRRNDEGLTIQPWDYLYYAERVRQAQYNIDIAQLSPYFELGRMLEAAIWSAEQRYGVAFKEITGTVPVFHQDVRVWEVLDVPSGAHRGLFYLDTFARSGKRSGAWASSYRDQYRMDGGSTAIVSNNNNFLKGAPGEPMLVSLDDVRTLFHEFGHSLHWAAAGCHVSDARGHASRLRRTAVADQRAMGVHA